VRDADDHRVVRLELTPGGARILTELSEAHLEELARLTPLFQTMLATLGDG
jgi:DNA-binding MarR family transcriptional regulator